MSQAAQSRMTLKELLENPVAKKYFRNFLIEEFCLDNLLFYEEVNRYRECGDDTERLKIARSIYNEFISTGSPNEVNVTYEVRKQIESRFEEEASVNLFDLAGDSIFDLMEIAMHDRFYTSHHWQEYIQHAPKGGCCG